MKLPNMPWRLCRRNRWGGWSPVKQEEAEERGPHLLMIDDDLSATMKTGYSTGRIKWKGRFEGDKERLNILRGDKLLRTELWGVKIPLWVHYKNEVYGYPHAPKADAEALGKTFVGLQQNWKNLEEASEKLQWKRIVMYLKLAGYLAAGIALVYMAPILIEGLFGFKIPVPWLETGGGETVKEVIRYVNDTVPTIAKNITYNG